MKNALLSGILSMVSVAVVAQAPVAFYPFNGNADDAVGVLHGVVNGATLTTDRFGNANSAYRFDGVDDFISYAAPWTTATNNFSLAVWVKASGSGGVIYNGENNLPAPVAPFNGYGFGVGTFVSAVMSPVTALATSNPLTANTWTFIAMVRESGTLKIYVNGLLEASASTLNPTAPAGGARIGSLNDNYPDDAQSFTGAIDDLKIYNVALTGAQVQAEFISLTGQNYRSVATGAWSEITTWEVFDGTSYVPASVPPSSTDALITIRNGHNVTVNSNIAINQTVIEEGATLTQSAEIGIDNSTGHDLTVAGTWDWLGSNLTPVGVGIGNVLVTSTGVLNLTTSSRALRLDLINNGTINWAEGSISVNQANPNITNNGSFNITNTNFVGTNQFAAGSLTINNSGTITKTGNGELSFGAGPINNSGTINLNAGSVTLSGAISSLSNTGNLNINGTFFNPLGGANIDNYDGGNISLNNGTFEMINGNCSLNNNAGATIKGKGIFRLAALAFTNNGTIAPGLSPGTLSWEHNQPLQANSTLTMEIQDGSGAGTGHDQLQYNGNTILAGTLTVTETGAVPFGTYTIISSGTVSGSFATVNLPAGYTLEVNATTVVVKKAAIPTPQQLPGSGNSISFDGEGNFAQASHNSNIDFPLNADFSIEFWIKVPASNQPNTTGPDNMIIEKWANASPDPYPFTIRYYNHLSPEYGQIRFGRYNGTVGASVISGVALNDNKWHHITGVKSGTSLLFYLDGMLMNTANDITTGSTQNAHNVYFGSRGGLDYFLHAGLDEVRIWNTALSQSQIRDRMCHKITPSDALYPNLVAYYNFDESTANTFFDGSLNASNGTLVNGPSRVTSGAALGDASSHDYLNTIKTTSLSHSGGESLVVTSTSGSPDGIHVYRVDEKPNTLTGTSGVGTNSKYFGVFQVGGTAPEYTAVYTYNPSVGAEADFRLFKRNDNAATSWTQHSDLPDQAGNTITVTGQNTEYVLGSIGSPLPVRLLSFSGNREGNVHVLQWKTAEESNADYFQIEQSRDGQSFVSVGKVLVTGNGNNNYSFTHKVGAASGDHYYRLKMVDFDNTYALSRIVRLTDQIGKTLSFYPNPVSHTLTVSGLNESGKVRLMTKEGTVLNQQTTSAGTVNLDLRNYSPGFYILQYSFEGGVINKKILKN